jgi:hypothetical protein
MAGQRARTGGPWSWERFWKRGGGTADPIPTAGGSTIKPWVVPDSLKSIYHLPMNQWLDPGPRNPGQLRGIPYVPMEANGSRVGGGTIGQVPQTTEGRLQDVATLNAAILEAIAIGKKRKVLPNKFVAPPPITVKDIVSGRVIASFSLAPDSTSMPNSKELLPIPHLENEPLKPPTKLSIPISDDLAQSTGRFSCDDLRERQRKRIITLRWSNLRTLFTERWLDSVVIDAYLHVMQEHFPLKQYLFMGSAESDLSLEEIRDTPGCFPFWTTVLWRDSHWSCILGNHLRKRLRYYNSQVSPGSKTPDIQTKPFHDLFSDYSLVTHSPAQQTGSTLCGAYATLSVFLMAMMDESFVNKITPEDAEAFRTCMLHQILLHFYLIPYARGEN